MEGLNFLNSLPNEVKEAIKREYGSIEKLYTTIYLIASSQYKLFTDRSTRGEAIKQKLTDSLYSIEDKLDDIGGEYGFDGRDITTEVKNDLGEEIVSKTIDELNKELAPYGTTFDQMRKLMEDEYGI